MLQNIRDNIQGVMAKVIIAIIIVPFAIFGIQSMFGGGGPVEVAKVNGEKITEAELQRAMMARKQQLLQTLGDKVTAKMIDDAALRGPALDGLIKQHLLQQGADELGLMMPVQLVDQTILSIPAFQEEGKFSPQLYQALLRSKGYTPAYFKRMLQQELVVNQMRNGLSESEFVTGKELQRIAGLLQQQRTFDYLTIPAAALAAKITPDDKDIEAYYQVHKDQYLSPERIKLDYIELRAEDYAAPLDEKALKAEYEREMAGVKPVVERRAAHILIGIDAKRDAQQARELAESIEKKIAAGVDFAKLAAQYSDDLGSKNSGGDLGVSDGTVFPPLFEQTLAQMKPGEVSAPVKTDDGYELLKLKDAQTKPLPTFAEKKAEIKQQLLHEKAQPTLLKNVEKLRDLAFNSDGLKGPAAELKVAVKESGWLERKNKDPLFDSDKIMAAAFSDDVLKDHNNSAVIELSPDHYVVVHVNDHQAAAPKPLIEVKDAVAKALKQERAHEQAERIAAEIIQHLAQGEAFKEAAAAAGYTAKSVENATRNNSRNDTPYLLHKVFAMPRPVAGKPLPVGTVKAAGGDLAVVQLRDVAEGQPDTLSAAQRTELIAQLRRGFGTADFAAFMDSLHARAEIENH